MLWETSQQLTNLPPLPHETRRFIAAFINCDQDMSELASELNEDFFEVFQKLCDPLVKTWLAAINALKNNERRERALAALDRALTNEHNPNHIRRAATRILRHFELKKPRFAKDRDPVARSSSPCECAIANTAPSRAIEVVGSVGPETREDRDPATSMQTTRDVETNIAPQLIIQPPVEKSQPTTPGLSKLASEARGLSTKASPTPNPPQPLSASSAFSAVKPNEPCVRHLDDGSQPVPRSAFSAHPAPDAESVHLASHSAPHPTPFPADNPPWPSPPPIPRSPPPAPPYAASAS